MSTAPSRPPIPANLRRRVLVEAGHRCAIPTCRYIQVDLHHIIPWTKRKEHKYENLIALCPNCHTRADRGEIDRKSLRLYKANLRFAHDRFSQFEMDVLFAANEGETIQWPPFMHRLIKRLLDAGFVETTGPSEPSAGITIFEAGSAMTIYPSKVYITEKGQQFLQDIGLRKL